MPRRSISEDLTVSRSELQEMVDALNRASLAADHCAAFCVNAQASFQGESTALLACKRALERFLRA